MKKFTAPEMDVLKFAVEDIINASAPEVEETEAPTTSSMTFFGTVCIS